MLIENNLRGERWAYAIVGIGININQTVFPESASRPVSLRQITGLSADPVELARELGAFLDLRYTELQSDAGRIIARYNTRLYGLGREVILRTGRDMLHTVVTGVSPDGKLLTKMRQKDPFPSARSSG